VSEGLRAQGGCTLRLAAEGEQHR